MLQQSLRRRLRLISLFFGLLLPWPLGFCLGGRVLPTTVRLSAQATASGEG